MGFVSPSKMVPTLFFFFNDTATTEIYTLSLHGALPIYLRANSIVSLAVEELALHIRALARRLFGDERAAVPVAFAGGNLQRGSVLRKRLEHRLKVAVPGAQVTAHDVDPARGAVRGALRFLGAAAG